MIMMSKYYIIPIVGMSQEQISMHKLGEEIHPDAMINMDLLADHVTAMYWDDENEVTEMNIDGQLYTSRLMPEEILSLPLNYNNQN